MKDGGGGKGWLSGYEHRLPLQSPQAQFLAPTADGSQVPVPQTPGDPMTSLAPADFPPPIYIHV